MLILEFANKCHFYFFFVASYYLDIFYSLKNTLLHFYKNKDMQLNKFGYSTFHINKTPPHLFTTFEEKRHDFSPDRASIPYGVLSNKAQFINM